MKSKNCSLSAALSVSAFAVTFVLSIFPGCKISETKESEEILEPREDYELDLSKISVNNSEENPAGTYDIEKHILTIDSQWGCAQIWFGTFDASQYRYLKIEYESADSESSRPFRLHCRYSQEPSAYSLCERKRTVQYVALDRNRKNSIKSVFIQSQTEEPVSHKIKSMCFTQNKILSPEITDNKGNKTIKQIPATKAKTQWQKSTVKTYPFMNQSL